jgi:MFS transporter, PPP family, 3-phenylpropionic acid transporter
LYLKDLGFTAEAIGTLAAILIGTKIVAPNLWGWLADHTGRRMAVIRIGSFLACLTFAGVLFTQSYFGLALVMLVFGLFSNAALPQVEATTLNHLRDRAHGYSQVRVWGSVGFIAAVGVAGWLLADQPLAWVPWIILALLFVNWLVTLQLPRHDATQPSNGVERFRQVLRKPEVLALISVCLLMQASHGPYYTFYSLYLQEAGYGLNRIGELWALGVLAEVGLFLVMHRLLLRYGLRRLLLASLVLAAIRWGMIGEWVDSISVLIAAQLLHAATFGIYHAVTIQLIHRHFTGRLQGRGQALYSSLSFGAGLALGSLISGYLWEAIDPVWSFRFAVFASLLALMVAWKWVKE